MFIHNLFEADGAPRRLVVTYPGRFQPFHKGHRDVFANLQRMFGRDNVFIVTSNKTDAVKSPFNFSDKVRFMHAMGIPDDRVIETDKVYDLPPIFADQKPHVVFVTVVGGPDAKRLNPGATKKDGSPAYFQQYPGKLEDMQSADQHGYVIVEPEHAESIVIGGQKYDVSHGTPCRELWNQVRNNPQQRAEFIQQLYGRNDPDLGHILDKIPTTAAAPAAPAKKAQPVKPAAPVESIGESVDEGREEALQFATQAHAGQKRAGGAPYISHPVRVAQHVEQWKQSHNIDALISAAYLHDTLEDTDTTHEALHDLFGGLVASLVLELTSDPEQVKQMGKQNYLAHKMAAMSSYALVIKLADRLDNVKDIATARTPEWRARYAAETNHILDFIEKNRALSSTHQKLIGLIRDKLQELNNPQGVTENAEELHVGDPVVITGPVEFEGSTGEVYDFGRDKRFVIVNLYNHGQHSFHSSDVSYNDYADSEEENRRMTEDAAGVGMVKNSKDPRYVMATMGDQNDVDSKTLGKMMKAYHLTGVRAPKTQQTAVKGSIAESVRDHNEYREKIEKLEELQKRPGLSHEEREKIRDGIHKIEHAHHLLTMESKMNEAPAQKHTVLVTVSDPNGTMASKRKELRQRRCNVTAPDRETAVNSAIAWYRKQGYKVHDHHYVGPVPAQNEATDAVSSTQNRADGSPYDRGVADGYYGRRFNPHKYVGLPNGNRQRVDLTDPAEVAEYKAGYNDDSYGSKDYGESVEGKGISKDAETKFHAKLDTLVHDTFGKRKSEQGMAEGVAESVPMSDAVKVLKQYGADHFKTGSESLKFYKDGRAFSVDLIWNDDATRSVSLSQLNSATRGLKGQGVAEGIDTEELANEVYAEFERIYPNLARRADERTVHAAIMDVLNYGGDSDPGALAQDVARAVKQEMQQGMSEGSELKQAKRKYNQAAKDANADQVGAGKKIDTMKKSLRQRDVNKQGMAEANNNTGVKWFDFTTWVLKQGDKYKGFTTNHTVYQAAEKAYKAYVKSQKQGMSEAFQNDESNLFYRYDTADGKLKQKMIDNLDERAAKAQGYRETQEQALRVHNIIRSKFNPKKWVQNQGGKWVEVFPFGQPAGTTEAANPAQQAAIAIAKKKHGEVDEDMYQYDKADPFNSEFAPRAGMGRMTLRGWKQSLARRVAELSQQMTAGADSSQIDNAAIWDNVYRKMQSLNLDPIAQEIELAHQELERIRQRGGIRSRAFKR